jgi:acetyl esterase/lipase
MRVMEDLDPNIAANLAEQRGPSSVDPVVARTLMLQRNKRWNDTGPALPSVADVQFPTSAGPLRLRLYGTGDPPAPVLLYLHGGGWVFGLDRNP